MGSRQAVHGCSITLLCVQIIFYRMILSKDYQYEMGAKKRNQLKLKLGIVPSVFKDPFARITNQRLTSEVCAVRNAKYANRLLYCGLVSCGSVQPPLQGWGRLKIAVIQFV